MELKKDKPGIGPTRKLSLRVSVAVLVNVSFKNPENGKTMLALERTATLVSNERKLVVEIKAKPFGGGVRLLDPQGLKNLIGEFHFDSERSREQSDFRIQVNPRHWETIIDICKSHLKDKRLNILDPSPAQEIAEEFEDSLHIKITPEIYRLKSKGMIVEENETETTNVNARGMPTRRIYYLFNALLKDKEIITMMLDNNKRFSDTALQTMAIDDARQGGKGRANAVLLVSVRELKEFYRSTLEIQRSNSMTFKGHLLSGNVPAILDDITVPRYQRYP